MTDERVDTELKTTVPEDDAELPEYGVEALFDGAMDLQRALEKGEISQNQAERRAYARLGASPELWALAGAALVYGKAFLEALAKRHADGLANFVHPHIRKHGKNTEVQIGLDDDGSAATIVVTADLPDEARLALLDLDVTDDAVRGKLLRWDSSTSVWRPADDT